ncbi:FtsX-like permease family protein [candidate division WOR-3 bacterium]|uniref:FtsX-like permease family protein n=1 Tax=candidate division WOR-3 bacterium TaxID=2052148 RepID=A0A9D5QDJ6_UNCW3|nr:FtsX-like permease family protein [candidate division WOR-3 bacterium]MBD3365714.1 FtsX-like permease family protein [candidate division WOR-3 bacterium]
MLARLAWRNTFRHTRRTIITALAIAGGITFLILFDTLYGGMKNQSARVVLDYENSSLVLLPEDNIEDYRFNPLDDLIENPREAITVVEEHPAVASAAPRLRFNASLNVAGDELIAMGMGLDPELDPGVFRLDEEMEEGSFLQADGDLVVGSGLAQDLGVAAGDVVMVTTRTKRGVWDVRQYTITGIINSGSILVNNNAILVTLSDAQTFLETGDAASEVNILVPGNPKDLDRLEEISADISTVLDGSYDAYTWREMNAWYFDAFEAEESVAYLLAIIIIVIALVGIVNTMLLSIYERIRELGTMRAMGFSPSQIRWLLIAEGAIIGLFASVAGVGLGILVSWPLVEFGMDFTNFMKDFDINMPFDLHLFGRFSPGNIAITFLFSWIISILASLIPAHKATKIEPSQALRTV